MVNAETSDRLRQEVVELARNNALVHAVIKAEELHRLSREDAYAMCIIDLVRQNDALLDTEVKRQMYSNYPPVQTK